MTTTASAETAAGAVPAAETRWDDAGRAAALPARLCAAVALVSVGTHVWMAWEHRAMPWESVLMLLMAAACLPCAVDVWRRGHHRAVGLLFVMALAMVGVHTVLLLGVGALPSADHGGMASMDMVPAHLGQGGMTAGQTGGMLAVIALELTVAMLAAWVMRRSRAAHTSGHR